MQAAWLQILIWFHAAAGYSSMISALVVWQFQNAVQNPKIRFLVECLRRFFLFSPMKVVIPPGSLGGSRKAQRGNGNCTLANSNSLRSPINPRYPSKSAGFGI
jgi:hypothetical protein